MQDTQVDELQQQIRRLAERVAALEAALARVSTESKKVKAVAFADLPTSPADGEVRGVLDKTVPGGGVAGCVAIYNAAAGVWVGPDGNDVSGY